MVVNHHGSKVQIPKMKHAIKQKKWINISGDCHRLLTWVKKQYFLNMDVEGLVNTMNTRLTKKLSNDMFWFDSTKHKNKALFRKVLSSLVTKLPPWSPHFGVPLDGPLYNLDEWWPLPDLDLGVLAHLVGWVNQTESIKDLRLSLSLTIILDGRRANIAGHQEQQFRIKSFVLWINSIYWERGICLPLHNTIGWFWRCLGFVHRV